MTEAAPIQEIELFEVLDWEPVLRCEIGDCGGRGDWLVVWKCTCTLIECEHHMRQGVEAGRQGRGACDKHGLEKGTNFVVRYEKWSK